jgi:hypothetical protein
MKNVDNRILNSKATLVAFMVLLALCVSCLPGLRFTYVKRPPRLSLDTTRIAASLIFVYSDEALTMDEYQYVGILGFAFDYQPSWIFRPGWRTHPARTVFAIPFWSIGALFAWCSRSLLLRRWRRRHLDINVCSHCGYDLRAHSISQKCPECGNTRTKSSQCHDASPTGPQ